MRPFNLEAAKAGKKVIRRDGNAVRIVCYDVVSACDRPIIALIHNGVNETSGSYTTLGHSRKQGQESMYDLVMAPEIVERWVLVNRKTGVLCVAMYSSKADAECWGSNSDDYEPCKITFEI